MPQRPFHGAKLLLMNHGRLLTLLRDDLAHIPFPAHWDLPGGGREGDEAPLTCALRELSEELGLHLPPARVQGRAFPSHQCPGMVSWLFTGMISKAEIARIMLGDEGQEWRMMAVADYLCHPRAIPHFQGWVRALL